MSAVFQRYLQTMMLSAYLGSASLALSATPDVAAGFWHGLQLRADGTVWAWGRNEMGQLGDGTTNDSYLPKKALGVSNVKKIAAGYQYSVALKNDGTVWVWGWRATSQSRPYRVPRLDSIVNLYSDSDANNGLGSLYLVRSDGTLWYWPIYYVHYGYEPTQRYSDVPNIIAFAKGTDHRLLLTSDGSVWAQGNNESGQLGVGDTSGHSEPVQVTGISEVVSIVAGAQYSLALKSDGTVWMWGKTSHGDLVLPLAVSNLTEIVAIFPCSYDGCLALRSDGTVLRWWRNPAAGVRLELTGVFSLATGTSGLNLAQMRDGTVWAWGTNDYGQLGIPHNLLSFSENPIQIKQLNEGFRAVAAGKEHSLAVKSDGTVWAWGGNSFGQLGDGTRINRSSPVRIHGLTDIVSVAASNHSLALRNDGTLWAWGANNRGQLGDGTRIDRSNPVKVGELTGIAAVSAGEAHSLAVKNDGTLFAWGRNSSGSLGDGTSIDKYSPVVVPGLSNVIRAAAGYNHSLACKADGTVWAWGDNSRGQLGDGTRLNVKRTPVAVSGLSDANDVAAGMYFSLAKTHYPNPHWPNGLNAVWGWGVNDFGQLAVEPSTEHILPVRSIETNFEPLISAGDTYSTRTSGPILAINPWSVFWWVGGWGRNGDNDEFVASSGSVKGLPEDIYIATDAGSTHSMAVSSDGSIWAWGNNHQYQLGNGGIYSRYPVLIDDLFPQGGLMPNGWAATDGSAASWFATDISFAGPKSLMSGSVREGTHSGVRYTGNFRDGFLTFNRKVSTGLTNSWLRFYVDGVLKGEWKGELPWASAGAFIPSGEHEVAWKYEKGDGSSGGWDAAWIDSVKLPTTFIDVNASSKSFDHILSVTDAEVITPCGHDRYCPEQNVTRKQLRKMLIRAVERGRIAEDCEERRVANEEPRDSYCKKLQRAKSLDISASCGNSRVRNCADKIVSNQELAFFVVRVLEGEPPSNYCGAISPYQDVSPTSIFCAPIKRLNELQAVLSCGRENFCPNRFATREQLGFTFGKVFLGI